MSFKVGEILGTHMMATMIWISAQFSPNLKARPQKHCPSTAKASWLPVWLGGNALISINVVDYSTPGPISTWMGVGAMSTQRKLVE